MLSHLGRNVVLSRPISLLDIKDDDNGNVKPASQPSSQRDGWWAHSTLSWEKMESHKNKVVEMGSKSSALKGSSFVCTMTVLLVCCLPRKTSKKSSSSSKVDHPLVSRNFLWGHSSLASSSRRTHELCRGARAARSEKLNNYSTNETILRSNDKMPLFLHNLMHSAL